MHFIALATVLTAGAEFAAAQRHVGHQQFHAAAHAKREGTGSNPITVYVLNGHEISEVDVKAGLANGSLVYAWDGTVAQTDVGAAKIVAAASVAFAPTSSAQSSIDTPKNFASTSGALSSALAFLEGKGADITFPDGKLSCSDFPSDFGALSLDYLGLGGWSGIQLPGSNVGGYSDIMTIIASSCDGSNCCKENAFCSYACPAGLQKSQWPTLQGSTGQSVGGIQCRSGKLWLTNPAQPKLCMPGSSVISIHVKNTMSQQSSICRTDYPGTESETIPLSIQPGTTSNLTCPDGANYYQWEGKMTSAQYYVNNKGVSIQDACQWAEPDSNMGNFAPLNLGVGYSAGSAWLSIFQNAPTTDAKLDYKVEIVGNNGGYDNLAGRCKYSNGKYCSGDAYETCSSTGAGCTVAVRSGSATFVLSK
ncbi:hypothetical protein FH972_021888 [Carpinus fangiana]|uniref:Sushi domain-containing protein n=1 Tax=Carpinus fangiana TaxID=176857 RepID=A0A5N6KR04_9ROSI|nr:hypothetical protein FH972_021888 [Carpinus fangiana]